MTVGVYPKESHILYLLVLTRTIGVLEKVPATILIVLDIGVTTLIPYIS